MQTNFDTFVGPSFSLKDRLKRFVWQIFRSFVFQWIPVPFHEIRSCILRTFGATIGRGVHVYPGAIIWAPWNLVIGDEAGIANGAIIYSQGKIVIGKRAVVSQGVHLCAGTHDFEKDGMPLVVKEILIGNYAWLTADVFVHPGVAIGDGAVVGARSVVVKDLPEWMVCSGHPCKVLKARDWRPEIY